MKQEAMQADLIVLAIGGNDFLSILAKLDLTKQWADWTQGERDQLKSDIHSSIVVYKQQLQSILSIINKLNPEAKIVTQNQYLPLPKLKGTDTYLGVDAGLAELLVDARTSINNEFDAVLKDFQAKKMNISAIDAASTIEENVTGLTAILFNDPHPNGNGYKKLSQQYSNLIWGSYREVEPRKNTSPLSVVVDGKEVISKYPTKLINGRTYLVLSDITGAMKAGLSWSNKTQTAKITMEDRVVELTIGASTYKVNGKTYTLNADPAFLAKVGNESKTYVPVAALSEGLDFFVHYQPQTKTVFVNK